MLIVPQEVDVDGDGHNEIFWVQGTILRDGRAKGKAVWRNDKSRTLFDIQQGEVACSNERVMLTLQGILRSPGGDPQPIAVLALLSPIIDPDDDLNQLGWTIRGDAVYEFETKGKVRLFVDPCQ